MALTGSSGPALRETAWSLQFGDEAAFGWHYVNLEKRTEFSTQELQ
jgi:hypothetical protein